MDTVFVEDFTQANGTSWNSSRWNVRTAFTTVDVQSNQGRMTSGSISAANGAFAQAVMEPGTAQDIIVKIDGSGTGFPSTTADVGVACRFGPYDGGFASANWDTSWLSGIRLRVKYSFSPPSMDIVHRDDAGVETTLLSATSVVRAAFTVRLRIEGGTVSYKYWSSGSEPASWSGTYSLAGLGEISPGVVALGRDQYHTNSQQEIRFDNVVVSAASAGVNAGYTAQPMTASATMPGGVPVLDASVSATPMEASATTVDPDFYYEVTLYPSVDLDVSSSGVKGSLTADPIRFGGQGPEYRALVNFALPDGYSQLGLINATFSFRVGTRSGAVAGSLHVINSPWSGSSSGSTLYNLPKTFVDSVDLGSYTLDVTEDFVNFNGFMFTGSGTGIFGLDSAEDTAVSQRPKLVLKYHSVSASAGVDAEPMEASATMTDAGVSIGDGHTATPMTADAVLMDPTIVAEQFIDVEITASPMTGEAMFQTGPGFTRSVIAEAGTGASASAEMIQPSVETTRGVVIKPAPLKATATWKQPALVNGNPIVPSESDDNYFQRVNGLSPKFWLRMNEVAGTAAGTNRVSNSVFVNYRNIHVGRNDAPDGRASVHFNGDGGHIEQIESGSYGEINEPTGSTLEFSFRTDKKNTFLMSNSDYTNEALGISGGGKPLEYFLTDGKFTIRRNSQAQPQDTVAFTNLADGNWHHVVVRNNVISAIDGRSGMEVWIDGKLEIRRYGFGMINGFPDHIGWRPATYKTGQGALPFYALPSHLAFEGDFSEVVYYNHSNVTPHHITWNFYAFQGWKPIEAGPMEAIATAVDAKGGGNQKRALYLYWRREDERTHYKSFGDAYAKEFMTFDPVQGVQSTGPKDRTFVHGGFLTFPMSIPPTTERQYRDKVTDESRIIDLEEDINLDDFDMIMFNDWPDESDGFGELDSVEYNWPGQKERLIRQLRDANDRGIGLFVTNPRLAVDLGIIDRVEWVPNLLEKRALDRQGNASGLYDYGSAVKFPWNISGSDGMTGGVYALGTGEPMRMDEGYLDNKAYFYHDTNHNNRFRVRALVEGLTDLGSWMLQDAVYHRDYDPWGWSGAAYKYLKRENGLTIGDEFIFYGSQVIPWDRMDPWEKSVSRSLWIPATPPENVKAGTVVTTFGASHWEGKSIKTNPYKDYATTIVLQPGDNLAGRPVGGRIFVNFTEMPSVGLAAHYQITPKWDSNVQWPRTGTAAGPLVETPEQQEWDDSWTRATLRSTQSQQTQKVTITLPNGSTTEIDMSTSGAGGGLAMTRSNWLYNSGHKLRLEMTARGLMWLYNAEERSDNDAVIRTTAAAGSAEFKNPAVTAERDNVVTAQPMRAIAQMPKVAEDVSGDVDVYAMAMEARAEFTGYGKTISVAPMLGTAELVENLNMVRAGGESVTLTLHGLDLVTLYLKEEA